MTLPARYFLDDQRTAVLSEMLGRITRKYHRNDELSQWYHGKKLVRSLELAIDPEFNALETVAGWPAIVVDKLMKRRTIDRIVVPDSNELTAALRRVWVSNELDLESRMLHTAKAIHGIAFVVVYRRNGRTIVLPIPATRMTCNYDRASREVTAAAHWDEPRERFGLRQATLYTPEATVVVEQHGARYLVVDEQANPSGMVPVVRFVNRPALDAQASWGASLITPEVLSITKSTVRTLMSMEVAREFYSMPKEIALNVDLAAFTTGPNGERLTADQAKWQARWGRFLALTGALDEQGEPSTLQPDFKQLPASSPSPLIELLKANSQMISAATGYPPSMFGFVTDNPPGGDSMGFFESDLVLTAEQDNITDAVQWQRVHHLALLAERLVTVDELPEVQTLFRGVKTYQEAAATDAVQKQIAAGVLPASSDVALEKLNYSAEQIARIRTDRLVAPPSDMALLTAAIDRQTQPLVDAAA